MAYSRIFRNPTTEFLQGYEAAKAGQTTEACPYTDRSARARWMRGFKAAQR